MSNVIEQASSGTLSPKNGKNGTAAARQANFKPLGLNAQKVVAKRYSVKDENGEAIETWEDIVRRVVGHVSTAETDPTERAEFYSAMSAVMLPSSNPRPASTLRAWASRP